MKKAICLPAAVGLALLLFGGGRASAQMRAKTVDGVTVVTNGKEPAPPPGAATKLVLDEIYSAGGGSALESSFSDVTALDVGADGTAYVLDSKDCRVRVFDARGEFLRAFGRKGQGPGEWNLPAGIVVTPGGEILIEDLLNRRLSIFSPDGGFLRHVTTASMFGLSGVRMDGRGLIVGVSLGISGSAVVMEMRTYGEDFSPGAVLARFEVPVSPQTKVNPFTAVNMLFELDGRGNVLVGSRTGYEIRVLSPAGKLLRTFGREYDPVSISQTEMAARLKSLPSPGDVNLKDRIEIPKTYPPYSEFVLADEGRLLVKTFEKGKSDKERRWDVFDAEGRYVAKIALDFDLQIWRGGKVYGVAEDADGFKILKCFRARWAR